MAVAAGLATLKVLAQPETYEELEARALALSEGITSTLGKHGIEGVVNRVASMLTVFFGVGRVRNAAQARQCNKELFASFFHGLLARGVYWPPSPFETVFVSLAHEMPDLEETLRAIEEWAVQKTVV
jgi:glutamate-1-semialdehyde 2,1-aminomutase